MNTLYLWIDLCSIIPPLLFSFHPKLKIYKYWFALFPAIIITAIAFIAWDMLYTQWGVWGFNANYLLGHNIGNLPIEEILFFICIPYACIFSYECFKGLIKKDYFQLRQRTISVCIIAVSIIIAIIFWNKLYTSISFGGLAITLILLEFVLKVTWLSRFYFAYIFLLIPFTIVNGILTGTGIQEPIVWYNPDEFIGIRILTIPFEDIFYGMFMLLCSIGIYEYLIAKKTKSIISN